jgi:nucleotide-binding universal stress UspA family protein
MYDHLLVALDGSKAAERVLEHATALAGAFGSRVVLLRASEGPEALLAQTSTGGPSIGDVAQAMDPTPILEAEQSAAADYLNEVAERLRADNVLVETEHPEGQPAQVIVERANALGVSLILMTTHGRSGLGRVVFGSVADSVLRHATCPVLMVRVTAEDDSLQPPHRKASP